VAKPGGSGSGSSLFSGGHWRLQFSNGLSGLKDLFLRWLTHVDVGCRPWFPTTWRSQNVVADFLQSKQSKTE
jgi:hypothetical protein